MILVEDCSISSAALHSIIDFLEHHVGNTNDSSGPLVTLLTGYYDKESRANVTAAYRAILSPCISKPDISMQNRVPISIIKWHLDCYPKEKIIGYAIAQNGIHNVQNPFMYTTYLLSLMKFSHCGPLVLLFDPQKPDLDQNIKAYITIQTSLDALLPAPELTSSVPSFIYRKIPVANRLEAKESAVVSNLTLTKFCENNSLKLNVPANLHLFKHQCLEFIESLLAYLDSVEKREVPYDAKKIHSIYKMLEEVFSLISKASPNVDQDVI